MYTCNVAALHRFKFVKNNMQVENIFYTILDRIYSVKVYMTKNLRVVEKVVLLSGGHSVCHSEWFCQTGQGSVVPE